MHKCSPVIQETSDFLDMIFDKSILGVSVLLNPPHPPALHLEIANNFEK